MDRLISDLLTMSRLDSGDLPIDCHTVVLQDVISEVVEDWRLRGTLRLVCSLPGEPLYVRIDPMRTREVLQNLLENAEKYAPDGRVVSIQVDSQRQVEVVVSDNGPGVLAEELSAIFTKSYRAAGRQGQIPGSGLGLSICKGIVEAQGGNIYARLPHDGGLAVCFTLPLSAKNTAQAVD
jgi:two-component system sensor histidine kinase KdpD